MRLALLGPDLAAARGLALALQAALAAQDCAVEILDPAARGLALASSERQPTRGQAPDDVLLCIGTPWPDVAQSALGLFHAHVLTCSPDPALVAQEEALRTALMREGLPFQALWGDDTQQLDQLMAIVRPQHLPRGSRAAQDLGRWQRACEKCSDPQCEHRLFSALLQARGGGDPLSPGSADGSGTPRAAGPGADPGLS